MYLILRKSKKNTIEISIKPFTETLETLVS